MAAANEFTAPSAGRSENLDRPFMPGRRLVLPGHGGDLPRAGEAEISLLRHDDGDAQSRLAALRDGLIPSPGGGGVRAARRGGTRAADRALRGEKAQRVAAERGAPAPHAAMRSGALPKDSGAVFRGDPASRLVRTGARPLR